MQVDGTPIGSGYQFQAQIVFHNKNRFQQSIQVGSDSLDCLYSQRFSSLFAYNQSARKATCSVSYVLLVLINPKKNCVDGSTVISRKAIKAFALPWLVVVQPPLLGQCTRQICQTCLNSIVFMLISVVVMLSSDVFVVKSGIFN